MTRGWSSDMTNRLVEYLDAGMTRGAAADLLNVTRNAAIGKAYRMGYDKNYVVAKRKAFLAELDALRTAGLLCRIRSNNNCEAPVRHRLSSSPTQCSSSGCSNTRLPGYLHGLCSTCNTERLTLERKAS